MMLFKVLCGFLSIAACAFAETIPEDDTKLGIYKGKNVDSQEAKSVVAITFKHKGKKNACAGVLLNKNTVLTTAYCGLRGRTETMKVFYGSHDVTDKKLKEIKVSKVYAHPKFTKSNSKAKKDGKPFRYDVAILKLKGKISDEDDNVAFAKLSRSKKVYPGINTGVYGWGKLKSDSKKDYSRKLKKTPMSILYKDQCAKKFKGQGEHMICGQNPESSLCYNDFGAPMFFDAKLIGIASIPRSIKKDQCSKAGKIFAFAKIADPEILQFIEKKLKKEIKTTEALDENYDE